MPVGLAEIHPNAHSFFPEGAENILRDIAAGVGGENAFAAGDLVIGVAGVVHAKAVVVFGGEHQVLHAAIGAGFGPLLRVELLRVESMPDLFVFTHIGAVIIRIRAAAFAPGLVFGAEAPAFHNSPFAVRAPVDDHPEFPVLPGFQLRAHFRIGRPMVSVFGQLIILF